MYDYTNATFSVGLLSQCGVELLDQTMREWKMTDRMDKLKAHGLLSHLVICIV